MQLEVAKGKYAQAHNLNQQVLEIPEANGISSYVMEVRGQIVRLDYYEHGNLPEIANVSGNFTQSLNTYRLEACLEAVTTLAIFKAHEGDYQRATQLLASVLEHPKCPPVFQDKYQPINTLRQKLQTELGHDKYEAVYERAKQIDFEDVVAQIKEEYSPS